MTFNDFFQEAGRLAAEHAGLLKGLVLGSAAFFILTPILTPALIVLMPADSLVRPRRRLREMTFGRRAVYLAWHLLKDAVGIFLMLLGFLLLFMPGQGLLTIFAGLLITDLPGKRRFLAKMLGSGKIKPAVLGLRARFNRAELCWPRTSPEED